MISDDKTLVVLRTYRDYKTAIDSGRPNKKQFVNSGDLHDCADRGLVKTDPKYGYVLTEEGMTLLRDHNNNN